MITSLDGRVLVASLFFDLWMFDGYRCFSLGIIGRLCCVIVSFPGHILNYFCMTWLASQSAHDSVYLS